jgi:hypothetical protein
VDEYLDARGLRRHAAFHQLLQALIELAWRESDERALLESLSNHLGMGGAGRPADEPPLPPELQPRGSVAAHPEEDGAS